VRIREHSFQNTLPPTEPFAHPKRGPRGDHLFGHLTPLPRGIATCVNDVRSFWTSLARNRRFVLNKCNKLMCFNSSILLPKRAALCFVDVFGHLFAKCATVVN
jgi:hypothetical protein